MKYIPPFSEEFMNTAVQTYISIKRGYKMHPTSIERMKEFINICLDKSHTLNILDVGSESLGGDSYRILFKNDTWNYYGLDLQEGANVDIVSRDPYHWPIADHAFDVVISGQVLEHVEDTHAWMREISRVLKPRGLVCIIAPTEWVIHRHPVDCWRILPDGMIFLLEKIAGLNVIRAEKVELDCVGIAQKL